MRDSLCIFCATFVSQHMYTVFGFKPFHFQSLSLRPENKKAIGFLMLSGG